MNTSTLPNSAKQPAFDPVAAGAEIDKVYGFWQQIEKQAAEKAENAAKLKADLIRLLQHAKVNAPNFKEFVEKHTHVARSTAYRLLGIEEGRGDEIREKERDNKRGQRANVSGTKPVPDTPPDTAGNDDDPEKSAAERKFANAELDKPPSKSASTSGDTKQVKRGSQEHWLSEFRVACEQYLPMMEEATRAKAKEYVMTWQPKRHLKVVA